MNNNLESIPVKPNMHLIFDCMLSFPGSPTATLSCNLVYKGKLIHQEKDVIINGTTNLLQSFYIELTEGDLINCSIEFPNTINFKCFAFCKISIGILSNNNQKSKFNLTSGRFFFKTPLIWPCCKENSDILQNNKIQNYLPSYAVGVQWVLYPPSNHLTNFQCFNFDFATNAVVKNRTVYTELRINGNAVFKSYSSYNQTASLTKNYNISTQFTDPAGLPYLRIPLANIELQHVDSLLVSAINFDAGDQFLNINGYATEIILPQ